MKGNYRLDKEDMIFLAIITAIVMAGIIVIITLSRCEKSPRVKRVVELHYINGEIETRMLYGTTFHQPRIKPGYTPYYTDVENTIYGVIRFRVLQVDTIRVHIEKGGDK